MNEVSVECEIESFLKIINGYFKEGTTYDEKIQWITEQIEFRNETNRSLRKKIKEDRTELRESCRKVLALRTILREI